MYSLLTLAPPHSYEASQPDSTHPSFSSTSFGLSGGMGGAQESMEPLDPVQDHFGLGSDLVLVHESDSCVHSDLEVDPITPIEKSPADKSIGDYLKDMKNAVPFEFSHSRSNSLDLPHASLATLPPNTSYLSPSFIKRSHTPTEDEVAQRLAKAFWANGFQELTPATTPANL